MPTKEHIQLLISEYHQADRDDNHTERVKILETIISEMSGLGIVIPQHISKQFADANNIEHVPYINKIAKTVEEYKNPSVNSTQQDQE